MKAELQKEGGARAEVEEGDPFEKNHLIGTSSI